MSSIMRRPRGLISAIGGSPVLRVGLRHPQSSQTGVLPLSTHPTPATPGSFNPFSDSSQCGYAVTYWFLVMFSSGGHIMARICRRGNPNVTFFYLEYAI